MIGADEGAKRHGDGGGEETAGKGADNTGSKVIELTISATRVGAFSRREAAVPLDQGTTAAGTVAPPAGVGMRP
jgi:hypothetical protein